MKSQHIAVIFIIIILPISIVISYSIGKQIDTIKLQTEYNTKLTDSTYDAIKAFQINTVNNRYSSISTSKIRDIEASINTFFKSLANSEPISEEELKSYVPALVYTLYDGYYIYSKYDNIYPKNNGQPILDENVLKQKEAIYGIKPYIYYSCRYRSKNGDKDFIVNYTLDNAITIYGNLGSGYETKSGYLIASDLVKVIKYNESNPLDWKLTYDGVNIVPEQLTEHLIFIDESKGDYDYIVYNGQKVYYDNSANKEGFTKYFYYQDYSKAYIPEYESNSEIIDYLQKRTKDGKLYSTSSCEYYYNAKLFSEDIINRLGDIKQSDAIEIDKDNNFVSIEFSLNTGEENIFNVSKDNNPLLSDSIFNEHRMAVIRKSIETNLISAIANYNIFSSNAYEFKMPILSETEWLKVTNNVSIISFLQGLPIGYKYYNNYCVITNNNNEEVVKTENIYIITEEDGEREYHLPGCKHLLEMLETTIIAKKLQNTEVFNTSNLIENNSNIQFIGDNNVLPGEQKVVTAKISANEKIGTISGTIKTSKNLISIENIIGKNGWKITYNKSSGKFIAIKEEGETEGDIFEITYKAGTQEGKEKIIISNINFTNIQYKTTEVEDTEKEIDIKKAGQPLGISIIGDSSVNIGEQKVVTAKISANEKIGTISGTIKTSKNLISIENIIGKNGWKITYNKSSGKFIAIKEEGETEGDIFEITYKAGTQEGKEKIIISNINFTNIQYKTTEVENTEKEIDIIKSGQPLGISIIGDSSVKIGEQKVLTVKVTSNETIGAISGILKNSDNLSIVGTPITKNGWELTYNNSNGKFTLIKPSGAKDEEILEITYMAGNSTGTGKVTLANLKLTNLEYETTEIDNVVKIIEIEEGIIKKYNIAGAYANISFLRQTVRIAEGNYLYFYPLTRMEQPFLTSCYYCIVNAGSCYDAEDIIKGEIKLEENGKQIKINSNNNVNFKNIREAYILALGRERNHLYQVNMDSFNK